MCSHKSSSSVIVFVTWCVRCSGWRYVRALEEAGSLSVGSPDGPYESHFLPQEETGPSELLALMQRAFLVAQECELDGRARGLT
jgi:hypothetical protein